MEEQLGINVEEKIEDIKKIVYKYFKVPNVPMEELLQDVYVAILHKNNTKSAHDPSKSSFGHYVYMVASNVSTNLVNKNRRKYGNTLSLDYKDDEDDKTIMESIAYSMDEYDESHLDSIESSLINKCEWELARYVRIVRTGANQSMIRNVMSYNGNTVNKTKIKNIRKLIKEFVIDNNL